MTAAQRVMLACNARRDALGIIPGKPLAAEERDKCINETFDLMLGEAKIEWEKRHKERRKAGIHPDAERVYLLYPLKVGREAALKAITAALQKHPVEYLLDKTNQFARCVADWPMSYRYFQDGADRCPHPSTWFTQGRYADDPASWKRHGARSAAPPPKQDLPEPMNWREAFPDFVHVGKPWHDIDRASQSYIVEQMKGRQTA